MSRMPEKFTPDELVKILRAQGENAFSRQYSLGMWNLCVQAANEIEDLQVEIDRFRALIAEIDKHTMFEAYGMGNSFADSIDCLVMHGGRCPTVEEAYAGALRCEKHR